MASSGSAAGSAALGSTSGVAPSDVAAAFGHTFWWAIGLSAFAIVPAVVLAVTQRRERREAKTSPPGTATPAGATT
jgi:hypothetical protein